MANHKSAAKRARQEERRTARNSRTKGSVRTAEKKLRTAISKKDSAGAQKLLVSFMSKVDKAAKKGIYHARTAARKVSRLSSQVSALK